MERTLSLGNRDTISLVWPVTVQIRVKRYCNRTLLNTLLPYCTCGFDWLHFGGCEEILVVSTLAKRVESLALGVGGDQTRCTRLEMSVVLGSVCMNNDMCVKLQTTTHSLGASLLYEPQFRTIFQGLIACFDL